jgi:hypothetical protein
MLVCLEGPRVAPWFTLVSRNVHVFSRQDLCYNTGHEADAKFNSAFDGGFFQFHDTEGG